jgi:pyrimidine operon attenuation protein/uracil phosphoribosyltransferase
MNYNPKIIVLYKENYELDKPFVNRLFEFENIKTTTIQINNKTDYYNLHGTRVDGIYISNKLKDLITNDEILDILEPMLNVSIFNPSIMWFSED